MLRCDCQLMTTACDSRVTSTYRSAYTKRRTRRRARPDSQRVPLQLDVQDSDQKSYWRTALSNGIPAFLVEDVWDDRAGEDNSLAHIAVSVCVGSYHCETAGVAHFLEHMLFNGSDAYPDQHEFGNFLKERGGYFNAYTYPEHTTYFMSIPQSDFPELVHRLSRFFVAPLMLPDAVEREAKVVDKEYARYLTSDDALLSLFLHHTGVRESKSCKFLCGNSQTLLKDSIRDELVDFFGYYNAHNLSISMQSTLSCDEMEVLLHDFDEVAKDGPVAPDHTDSPLLYDTPHFVRQTCRVPVRTLVCAWFLRYDPDVAVEGYANFLEYLLVSRSRGSLVDELDHDGLVEGVTVTYMRVSFMLTLFVEARLTERGWNAYDVVACALMSGLNAIALAPPETLAKLYEEYVSCVRGRHRLLALTTGIPVVQMLSENCRRRPYDEAQLLYDFAIEPLYAHADFMRMVDAMGPDAVVILQSDTRVDANVSDPITGAEFQRHDVPPRLRDALRVHRSRSRRFSSGTNPFATLFLRPYGARVVPARFESSGVRYWQIVPRRSRATMRFAGGLSLTAEMDGACAFTESAKMVCCRYLNLAFRETSRLAEEAGLRFAFQSTHRGMQFVVEGPCNAIAFFCHAMLQLVSTHTNVQRRRCAQARREVARRLTAQHLVPRACIMYAHERVTCGCDAGIHDVLALVPKVTCDDVASVIRVFVATISSVVAFGGVDVRRCVLAQGASPTSREVRPPASLDSVVPTACTTSNTAVLHFHQLEYTDRNHLMTDVFCRMFGALMFDYIRTERSMCYSTFCRLHRMGSRIHVVAFIEDIPLADAAVVFDETCHRFEGDLDPAQMSAFVQTVQRELRRPHVHSMHEMSHVFDRINDDTFDFDFRERMSARELRVPFDEFRPFCTTMLRALRQHTLRAS